MAPWNGPNKLRRWLSDCFCCFGHFAAVRLPPTIVKEPIRLKYYRSDDEVTLECAATGVPEPE